MSKSLYAQYIEERGCQHTYETEYGFATYEYQGEVVYIVDIYVIPEMRKQGKALSLALKIAEEAKQKGCRAVLGSVDPRAKNSKESLKAILALGMVPLRCEGELVYFIREL